MSSRANMYTFFEIVCPVDRVRVQLRRFTISAFKTNEDLLSKIEKNKHSPETQKSAQSARSKKSSSHEKVTSKNKKLKSSVKKVIEQPKVESELAITSFEENFQAEIIPPVDTQPITNKPFKSPRLERKQTLSPKKQVINF